MKKKTRKMQNYLSVEKINEVEPVMLDGRRNSMLQHVEGMAVQGTATDKLLHPCSRHAERNMLLRLPFSIRG